MDLATRIIEYLTVFLAIMILLPFHEFAHAFVAVKCGDNTPKINGRLTLNPFAHFDVLGLLCFLLARFGWAKPVPINPYNFKNYKRDSFFVAIAGVVANYILAFIFYPLALLIILYMPELGRFKEILFYTVYYVYYLGLTFFIFNLIPVFPLDGFRVIETFCNHTNIVFRFLRDYGRYILLSLFFLSVISSYINIPQLNILGNAINFVYNYISIPIIEFWGLIF